MTRHLRIAGFCPMGCGQTLERRPRTGRVVCTDQACPQPDTVATLLADKRLTREWAAMGPLIATPDIDDPVVRYGQLVRLRAQVAEMILRAVLEMNESGMGYELIGQVIGKTKPRAQQLVAEARRLPSVDDRVSERNVAG